MTETEIRFQWPSLIRSLYFLIFTVYLSYSEQVLLPIAVMPFSGALPAREARVGGAP